jgi:transposase
MVRQELASCKEELRLTKEELNQAKAENVRLKQRINELNHKKNSNNSSIAPSQDINRKTKSLRTRSGKKNGGQYGHEASNLSFVENSDKVEKIKLIPQFCQLCGEELNSEPELIEKRQVTDIPKTNITIQEYQLYGRLCECGHFTKESFPNYVAARTCYGPNIQAMIAYFSVRQYISVARIKETFRDIFGLSMSQGTIVNHIYAMQEKCLPSYRIIGEQIEKSKVIGSDETGTKVSGSLKWAWTWITPVLTYIVVSCNRGIQTINETFPNGFPKAVLVHDCWKAHFKTLTLTHQICIAHLLRELNYFLETEQLWAKGFHQLLLDGLHIKEKMLENPENDQSEAVQIIHYQKRKLLDPEITLEDKKLNSLKKRLIKYDSYIFTFLDHLEVPPDNNLSERAIRNFKVKLKVSGFFKTMKGAEAYAVIRSVVDTTVKNGQNVFEALSFVAKFG